MGVGLPVYPVYFVPLFTVRNTPISAHSTLVLVSRLRISACPLAAQTFKSKKGRFLMADNCIPS